MDIFVFIVIICASILCILLVPSIIAINEQQNTDLHYHLQSQLSIAKRNWTKYRFDSTDRNRQKSIRKVLQRAAGVLNRKLEKYNSQNLDRTVWLTLIESYDVPSNNRYKLMARNFMCYMKHYNIKLVLVLLDNNSSTFSNESKNLSNIFGDNISIISYPFNLFWQFVSNKNSVINRDYNAGDYMGSVPSFKHFGALVTLVSIYELLREGYNIIYTDVDISLLRDPIPFLTSDDIDFVASQELRSCMFPSFLSKHTDWSTMEPNTGVLYLKYSNASMKFMHRWIEEMVHQNKMNDQRILSFKFADNPELTTSCNIGEGNRMHQDPIKTTAISSKTSSAKSFKYCFLNEFLFQNGKMEFFCSKGEDDPEKIVFPAAYYLGMKRYSIHHNNSLSPVLLHVNYCDDKVGRLYQRGLLLFNQSLNTCTAFDPSATAFAQKNWTSHIKQARQTLAMELQRIRNGSLVTYRERSDLFFLLCDGQLRQIQGSLAAGRLRASRAQQLTRNLFLLLPRGLDIKY